MKKLVVNADDFGFTRDVNQGIVEAHTNGILTATTVMANGAAFDDAVRLANQYPRLDIGCHLVLIGGPSLLAAQRRFPATVQQLVGTVLRGRINIHDELRAQIERILSAGIHPTHLDTHKHTHLLPQVLDAVARLSEEYRIVWVRRPFDFPLGGQGVPFMKRCVSRGLGILRSRFHRKLEAHGCRTTDHFAGFELTGRFRARQLKHLIEALPEGTTEFMCHPGRCTNELRSATTRLKESREQELLALTDPEVRALLTKVGVELVSFRDLA